MRADDNHPCLGGLDRGAHCFLVARVPAAGDAGDETDVEHCGIVAGAFAEIGVEIEAEDHRACSASPA